MNSAVLLKISLMLGILVTLLLTPAFAQWVYYEFDTAPSVQKQYPIQMEEFNYEPQTVTLPGDSEVTIPPEGGDEGGDEGGGSGSVDLDGQNHSALIYLVTLSDDKKLDINRSGSILMNAIFNNHYTAVYSKVPNYSNGNLESALNKGLNAAGAEKLEFFITVEYDNSDKPTEIVIYSYLALSGSGAKVNDKWEVFQVYLTKDSSGEWVRDVNRTYVGDATVVEVNSVTPNTGSFLIVDPETIVYKTKQSN